MAFFVEALLAKKIDFRNEIRSLETLYRAKERWADTIFDISLSDIVDKSFCKWRYRGTFISAQSMRDDLGISFIIKRSVYRTAPVSLDEFVAYLEYLVNMLSLVEGDSLSSIKKTAQNNIRQCLEAIHYQISSRDDTPGLYLVVPEDTSIEKAIETTRDESLGDLFYSYVHYTTKGDLVKKSMILASIWKNFEGRREEIKKANSLLASEIGKLANTCDIRHKPDSEEAAILARLSPSEKEELYDALFQLYVDAFATLDAAEKIDCAEKLLAK